MTTVPEPALEMLFNQCIEVLDCVTSATVERVWIARTTDRAGDAHLR